MKSEGFWMRIWIVNSIPLRDLRCKNTFPISPPPRKETPPPNDWVFLYRGELVYAAAVLVVSFFLASTLRSFLPNKDQELVSQAFTNHARSLWVYLWLCYT